MNKITWPINTKLYLRRETPWNFEVSNFSLTAGANSPIMTPSIIDKRMSGERSLSRRLSSANGSAVILSISGCLMVYANEHVLGGLWAGLFVMFDSDALLLPLTDRDGTAFIYFPLMLNRGE